MPLHMAIPYLHFSQPGHWLNCMHTVKPSHDDLNAAQASYESFDDLGTALMTVLVVFIGENWNDVW